MLGVRAAGAVMMSALLLTACSGGDEEPPAEPSTTATTQSPSPTASATPTPTPSPTTSVPADAPASCAKLGLEPRADVQGRRLAACVADGLEKAGSGVQELRGEDLQGTLRFTWGDEVAYAGEVRSSDGALGLVVVPPTTWVDLDGAWTKADPNGSPDEVVAADVGGLYAQAADPGAAVDLLSGSRSWSVGRNPEPVKRPDGSRVTAWRLESSPFSADGAQVSDAVVWLDESLAPVAMQATVTADGTTSTTTRHFVDLGEPQQVRAPR
jgi:hypothetical protein